MFLEQPKDRIMIDCSKRMNFIATIACALCVLAALSMTGCQEKEVLKPETDLILEAPVAEVSPVDEAYGKLLVTEDFRDSFIHGVKSAEHQKYIVLHDTESSDPASTIVNWWDSNGKLIAAHFVVNRDGTIVQCAPLDTITHHAGFGDTGHNQLYGVEDESRDDMLGTSPIGSWASDYGMNSHSVGIELVHSSGSGPYTEEQLTALDDLIAYIDAYYGFESAIIDHKAWRTGNSDTSPEFAQYLANYQNSRNHLGLR